MRFKNVLKGVALPVIVGMGLSVNSGNVSACGGECYLGQIIMGGWNFCPRGTAPASGQLLPINSSEALFSLLGTQFGGDGRTTFGLPDMRGRSPIGAGAGPGLPNFNVGNEGGNETRFIGIGNLPPHNHSAKGTVQAHSGAANSDDPVGNVLAKRNRTRIYSTADADTSMQADAVTVSVGNTGGGTSINIRDPYLAITYCIVTQGIFPSRN